MTSWAVFGFIRDILINYYFGNSMIFYLATIVFFMVLLTLIGIDFRYTIVFSLPLIAAFSLAGVFGATSYIINVALLAVALVYAFAIMKIVT